jgi:PAS domain S-box-containing protein
MTDLKQVEQKLRESEAQFRTLANAIPQLCWMANADGWIFWYNQRWFEYTGTSAEQMEGWQWKSVHDPEVLPKVLERWQASIQTGQCFEMTFPLRGADGVYRSFLTRVEAVRDQEGKVTRWFGTHTDISERCKNEEALRNTVLLLGTVLENVGDGIYLKDCQSRMLLANPAYLQTLGKTQAEVLGRSEAEILTDSASAAAVLQNDRQTMERKTAAVFEETVVTPQGKRVYLSTKSPWLDRDGRVIGLIGVSTDITERQAAEQALRESEQRISRKLESILSPDVDIGEIELHEIINIEALQSLMNDFYEVARVPIAVVDNSGKVLVRAGWQEICARFHRVHSETLKNCMESDTYLTTGIAAVEFKLYKCKNNLWDAATPVVVGGRHLGNIFTGQIFLDDEPLNIDLFSAQARRHGFDEKEYLGALEAVPRMKRQNVDRIIRFLSKLGELVGKLSYANIRLAKSIAELERVQESLRQVSEQRGLALEAANLGTWDYRFASDEMFWDERCRKMFGIAASEQIRREDILAQVHPDDRAASDEAVKQAVSGANSGAYHHEYRVVWADGSLHWIASHGKAYFEGAGRERGATRLVGVTTDITDRKLAENEALQLNANLEARVKERTAQLQESNRELEAFSYSVSHDLRAPLRSIEGFAKILLRDYSGKPLDATAADYMQRMSDASQRMGHLIAELLTLSQLTRIEMNRKAVNLSEFARDILADCKSREPNRLVSTEIQAGLVANADPVLVRVALENLLGNAWKYTSKTDAAYIAFEAGVQQEELVFCIRDNGAGFDMPYANQLFAPFQRLHQSDEFEGNGIGLATVQRVIRRHGGRIWAESKPGEGAVFYFTLGEAPNEASWDHIVGRR